jgi:diguanylate cyclase (GGDEF)-like protein
VKYNELQETVLSLLDEPGGTQRTKLRHLLEEFRELPDLHTRLIAALINIDLDEAEAEDRFAELLSHHEQMEREMNRVVDLRVAAMDYLITHPAIVRSPTIVDRAAFNLTRRLAAVDELTGLYNRRFLETYLSREMNRALRYDQDFAVVFLDLDHFKNINDSYGHAVGDTVLRTLGNTITNHLRTEDLAARYGGEEFVIVLPQTTASGGLVFAERLRASVDGGNLVEDVHVTVSAGIAAYPRHGLTAEAILKRADEALYQAKSDGRNRVVASHADKRASTRYRADIPAVAFAGESRLGPLRLSDVSEDGCSLVSNDQLRPGEMVRVRVHTGDGDDAMEYEVLARIVWSHAISGSGPYKVGGLWDKPDRDAAARIVQTVSSNPSP